MFCGFFQLSLSAICCRCGFVASIIVVAGGGVGVVPFLTVIVVGCMGGSCSAWVSWWRVSCMYFR